MIGYYKLDQTTIDQLEIECRNIEDNIYELSYPLIVKDKENIEKELLYLYETLEIPIITYQQLKNFDFNTCQKQEKYIKEFSNYLQLNIKIEMAEEQRLGHLLRVGKYAKDLATSLGLKKEEIKDIYLAALFHDVGKYLISEEIIGKNSRLTEEEYQEIKTHSRLSREILGNFLNEKILKMIESHHERLDGSGYPSGIIPDVAVQIIGIADSYDAMVSNRVYQDAKNKENAFRELRLCTKEKEYGGKGKLYDEKLVEQFIKIEKNG